MGRTVIYLDANVIIRFVEGDPAAREPIRERLAGQSGITTSQLSRMECRCQPIRQGNTSLLALYDTFFAGRDLQVSEIDARVIDEATEIRARFNLKSPDAIHLAAATVAKVAVFLTGDKLLARFDGIAVEVI